MEFRRVQRTGRSTFIVSLPKRWADRKGLKAGKLVALSENEDGTLVLSLDTPRDFNANVDADHPFALRKLVSAYIAGAKTLALRGKNAAQMAETARQTLAAVDVIEEKKGGVVLRVFATGNEFSLHTLLTRMHAVCLAIFDLAGRAQNEDVTNAVDAREREMDRLYVLVLRRFSGFERGPTPSHFGALVAKAVENIADNVGQYALEKPRFGKTALMKVRAIYEKAMGQYLGAGSDLDVEKSFSQLSRDLDAVRIKSALEWARLETAAKACVEIEEVTEDVRAISLKNNNKEVP